MAGMMAQRVPDISHGNPIDLLLLLLLLIWSFFLSVLLSLCDIIYNYNLFAQLLRKTSR